MPKLLKPRRPATAKRSAADHDKPGQRSLRRIAAPNDAPKTLDAGARTVRAIIATDTPVREYDWENDAYFDEVLIPSGMIEPKKMALRVDHYRGSSRDVIGRVFDFRYTKNEVEATLRFNSAADVDEVFQRVAEGDLEAVSISAAYRMADTIEIPAGESHTVAGVKYTASRDCVMRLVTRWTPDETSVVDKGADHRALIRSAIGTKRARDLTLSNPTDEKFSRFQKGAKMPRRIKPVETNTGAATKTQRRRRTRDDIADATKPGAGGVAVADGDDDETDDDDAGEQTTRSGSKTKKATDAALARIEKLLAKYEGKDGDDDDEQETKRSAAKQARDEERARISRIRELGQGQPDKLVSRAINEGWTPEQFGLKVLERMQHRSAQTTTRQSGDGVTRAPAGHVRNNAATLEGLQAAVLLRAGHRLDNPAFATEAGRMLLERNHLGWLYRMNAGIEEHGNSDLERNIDVGRRFVTDSAARTCERILEVNTKNGPTGDVEEIVQRAFSNPFLPRVFGSIISVGLIVGYTEYADSTTGWTSEADWADFRNNQPIGIDANGSLRRHTRSTEAKDVDIADFGEAYAVARYTGKFQIDEMDIIDDLVGANQQMPAQMGRMAARLRPDLVYSVLLGNANLADGVPLFHTSRGNIVTGAALGIPGLQTAEAALATQVIRSKSGRATTMNLQAGFLIVPRTLRAVGKQTIGSTSVVHGNTTQTGNVNPHDGEYQLRSDARLDAGVTDPRTEQTVAGSTSNWYIAERSGQMTMQVGYRRGTGRAPQIRVRPLNSPGQFGIGWDIAHDIGVGVVTPRGMVRSS